jgi:hypothetical protein
VYSKNREVLARSRCFTSGHNLIKSREVDISNPATMWIHDASVPSEVFHGTTIDAGEYTPYLRLRTINQRHNPYYPTILR